MSILLDKKNAADMLEDTILASRHETFDSFLTYIKNAQKPHYSVPTLLGPALIFSHCVIIDEVDETDGRCLVISRRVG